MGFPIIIEENFGLSRDQLCDVLWKENVLARRYFYPGCDWQLPYADARRRARVALPHTDRCAEKILCLPCHPALEESTIRTISRIVRDSQQFCGELSAYYARHAVDPRIGNLTDS